MIKKFIYKFMGLFAPVMMKYAQSQFKATYDTFLYARSLKPIFKNMGCKDIFISDRKYKSCNGLMILKWLKVNNIFRFRKYVPEKFDCDNYSFALQGFATNLLSGYALGIVWVKTPKGGHALNFFIDENKEFWYIEPQSNKIFKRDDYKPFLIVM